MPFGGLRQSGNGWREAGHRGARRLLGLKTVYVNHDPGARREPCPSAVALVPARAGSKRVPGQEHARRSAGIRCSPTRSRRRGRAACSTRGRLDRLRGDRRDRAALRRRGAVPAPGGDGDRDLARHRVGRARARRWRRRRRRVFAILRPTSPFRARGDDPARVGAASRRRRRADSLRAVRAVPRAPGQDVGGRAATCMRPLLAAARASVPYALAPVPGAAARSTCRTPSLEIAWTRVVAEHGDDRRARASCRS